MGKEGISKLTVSVLLFYFLFRKAYKKLSQVFESLQKLSQSFFLPTQKSVFADFVLWVRRDSNPQALRH